MDGAVDLKILLSLGGVLFSVAGAAAIAKMQIKILADDCRELSRLLSALDTRCDKLHKLLSDTAQALERVKHLEVMHNTVHPPVASERKAR